MTRYERLLEADGRSGSPASLLLAEASRRTRSELEASDAHAAALRGVTTGVAGPCLTAYTAWCLRAAEDLGVDRLFFIARAGEVLLDIARLLQRRVGLGSGMELDYVHGSRGAWQLAAYDLDPDRVLPWLLGDATETTLRDLVGRAGLPLADDLVEAAGLEAAGLTADDRLQGRARSVVRRLAADPGFRSSLAAAAAEARRLTNQYFEERGIHAADRPGFVTTGWLGRELRCLDMLLDAAPGDRGRDHLAYAIVRATDIPPGSTRCYVVDARQDPAGEVEPARFGELVEVFTAGTEGTTLGYEERPDGSVAPVLASVRNEPAFAWGLPTLRDHLQRYAEAFCDGVDERGAPPTTRELEAAAPAVDRLLLELWLRPTPDEVKVLGGWQDADYGSRDWETLTPRVRWGDVVPWALNRRWIRWPYGTAELSPRPLSRTIRAVARLLRVAVTARARLRSWRRQLRAR